MVQKFKVRIGAPWTNRSAAKQHSELRNWQDKAPNAYPKEQSITKYSPGLPQLIYRAIEKLLWKPSEDAFQMSSWSQISLPIIFFIPLSTISVAPYSMMWDWLVSSAGPMPFNWFPACCLFVSYCVLILFFHSMDWYWGAVWTSDW